MSHPLVEKARSKNKSFPGDCVYVNTVFPPRLVTVGSGDEARDEFDWPAGEEMAHEEGLVPGGSGRKAPTARLECQPGFPGEFGIAASPGSGLRAALPRPRAGNQAR